MCGAFELTIPLEVSIGTAAESRLRHRDLRGNSSHSAATDLLLIMSRYIVLLSVL